MRIRYIAVFVVVFFSYLVIAQNDIYLDDSYSLLEEIQSAIDEGNLESITKYKPIFDEMLYFVELTDDPISTQISSRGGYQNFISVGPSPSDIKQRLRSQHNRVKSKIENINSRIRFDDDLYITLNGFFIRKDNLGPSDLYKIEELSDVYMVHADNFVHFFMEEAVPLIGADQVWEQNLFGSFCAQGEECLTGRGIKIAVIDSGVDYTHSDLGGCFGPGCKVEGGYDFGNSDDDPMDENAHGTHVAGIVSGKSPDKNNNGIFCEIEKGEFCGVAPDSTIYAYKVAAEVREGELDGVSLTFFSNVFKALELASDVDGDINADFDGDGDPLDSVDIVSMSLGLTSDPNDYVGRASSNLVKMGVVVVAAVGNFGYSGLFSTGSPGNGEDVIGVGASCKPSQVSSLEDRFGNKACDNGVFESGIDGRLASFSSKGPTTLGTFKPDILAPGHYICSTKISNLDGADNRIFFYPNCIDDEHIAISGTSMAAPIVSGAAALLKQKHPDWNAFEIKYTLKGTAEDLELSRLYQGDGQVNILGAVNSDESYPRATFYVGDDLFVGDTVDIIGVARSYSSAGFSEFILEYKEGIDQDTLSNSENWELITISKSEKEGLLHTFDSSRITGNSFTVRLIVRDRAGKESIDHIVYFKKPSSWRGNWPQKVLSDTSMKRISPVFGDLNGDGQNEIFVGVQSMSDAEVYLFDIDGNILWSKQLPSGVGITPALGDLNGDGILEIVYAGVPFFGRDYYIYAWDFQGNDIFEPIVEELSIPTIEFSSVTLSDVNNDGKDDILTRYLQVYDGSGNLISGPWEDIDYDANFNHPAFFSSDINGDGNNEVVLIVYKGVGDDLNIDFYIMDEDSILFYDRNTYVDDELEVGPTLGIRPVLKQHLAIGNVDSDINTEIVYYSYPNFKILDGKDLEIQNEFRIDSKYEYVNEKGVKRISTINGLFQSPHILVNVDNDEDLEIVYITGRRFNLNSNIVVAKNFDGSYVEGYPILIRSSNVNFDSWGILYSNAIGSDKIEPIINVRNGPEIITVNLENQKESTFLTSGKDIVTLISGFKYPQFTNIEQTWPNTAGIIFEDVDRDGRNEFLSILYSGNFLTTENVERGLIAFLGTYVFFEHFGVPSLKDQWSMYYNDIRRSNSVLPLNGENLFIRGDSNSDGAIDIGDAVFILNYLFLGENAPSCLDAADVNDDGIIEITDAVNLLNYLFSGGKAPHSPYPDLGIDSTGDSLTCDNL
jgi:subtilisin family serine protease